MKPYYEGGPVTIYHGDCREVWPAADVLVTDPPYGMSHYSTDLDALDVTARLARDSSRAAIFGYAEGLVALCLEAGVVPSEWITWWPTNAGCRGFLLSGLRREAEHIAVFGQHRLSELRQPRGESSRRIIEADYQANNPLAQRGLTSHGEQDTRRVGDVWTDAAPGLGFLSHKRQHPNEKPMTLMRRLVDGMSEPGQVVFDPFAGSGTTLRAAKDLGRKAIGIEIDERYCEIAAKRCAQEVLDLEAA